MLKQSQKSTTVLLRFSSSNKNSLKHFTLLLNRIPLLNINTKIKGLKIKKPLVSVLTSPHVNKVAQEQFNRKTYGTSLFVECSCSNKFFLILKSLVSQISDVKVKITVLTEKRNVLNELLRFNLNPDEHLLRHHRHTTAEYLGLLESYGEIEKISNKKMSRNRHL